VTTVTDWRWEQLIGPKAPLWTVYLRGPQDIDPIPPPRQLASSSRLIFSEAREIMDIVVTPPSHLQVDRGLEGGAATDDSDNESCRYVGNLSRAQPHHRCPLLAPARPGELQESVNAAWADQVSRIPGSAQCSVIWREACQTATVWQAGQPISDSRHKVRVRITVAIRRGDKVARRERSLGVRLRESWQADRLVAAIPALLDSAVVAAETGLLPAENLDHADSRPLLFIGGSAGIIAHEAIGHPLEADNIISGSSRLAVHIGHEIAPHHFTVIDHPRTVDGFGSWDIDDEGQPTRPVILVDSGTVTGVLTHQASASALGGSSTGHGRRLSAAGPCIPRMSTTVIMPSVGDPLTDAARTEEAIVCWKVGNGYVDHDTGQVAIEIEEAALLRHGEPVARLHPFTLDANLDELLRRIGPIGQGLDLCQGICMKRGQWLRVSYGAPPLLLMAR
jgi:predicted Zn-dependent protease